MSKLKLYTENEEGTAAWLDFHLNLGMIDGFYIPDLEDGELPSINVFVGGQFITVLQEEEIVDYLNSRFAN